MACLDPDYEAILASANQELRQEVGKFVDVIRRNISGIITDAYVNSSGPNVWAEAVIRDAHGARHVIRLADCVYRDSDKKTIKQAIRDRLKETTNYGPHDER